MAAGPRHLPMINGMSDENRNLPWLICFAVSQEAKPFRAWLKKGFPARVIRTGIGPHNARTACLAGLSRFQPAAVLTCGWAGALNPALGFGTVVFQADPTFPRAGDLKNLGAAPAAFHGSDRIIATAAEKERLRRETGADAVEMESQIIRDICRQRGVPSATVRVISDTAQENLPIDFNAIARPDYSISYFKLAAVLGRSPGKLPALLAFNRRLRQAAEILAGFLGRFLA